MTCTLGTLPQVEGQLCGSCPCKLAGCARAHHVVFMASTSPPSFRVNPLDTEGSQKKLFANPLGHQLRCYKARLPSGSILWTLKVPRKSCLLTPLAIS